MIKSSILGSQHLPSPTSEMAAFYITLSSDSSKDFFQDNTIAHFTTQLARPIHLTSAYEVAVCEVFLPPLETWKIRTASSPIYLYSDICQPVLLCDTSARLLRVLPPDLLSGHYVFPVLYYIPVEKLNFQTIVMSFHTKTGQRYPFAGGTYPSTVVLHFRECLPNK